MKSKYKLLLVFAITVVAVMCYVVFVLSGFALNEKASSLDDLIAPAVDKNLLANPVSDYCQSLGLEVASVDSQEELRCFQRPGGYMLVQELQEGIYYCVDTLGGSNTLELDQYYLVPEYCDLDLAIDKILIEQDKIFSELQQLVNTNNASAENQEKFRSITLNLDLYIAHLLQINPYNTRVIQAATEFYSLLGTVGVAGTTQLDIDNKIKEAQQKFKNY